MIGSIISAILWFLLGAVVAFGGILLFLHYCYKEIGGKKGFRKNKDEISEAGIEFLEIMFGEGSDDDTD